MWIQPGITKDTLAEHVAVLYRRPNPTGAVGLVLGAGNVGAIPPLESLHMLIGRGRVVLLKMNPVNDYPPHGVNGIY